jgi:hypothetical protein
MESIVSSGTETGGAGGVVSVTAFGFGADHDANLLRSICDGTNGTREKCFLGLWQNFLGMFYYVESAEKIALAFADSLGGLLSVVAQNLELTLEVALPCVHPWYILC